MTTPDDEGTEHPNSTDAEAARQPEGQAGGELFRFDPARPVIQLVAVTWLGGLVAVVVMLAVSGAKLSLITLGVVGFQSLAGGLGFGVVFLRSGVRVGPAGLAVVAPLQSDRWVRWDEIRAVRNRHVLLVPNLVLTGLGRPLVVPFVFRDPDGFAEAVARYAGDDHPLTEAVYERLATF